MSFSHSPSSSASCARAALPRDIPRHPALVPAVAKINGTSKAFRAGQILDLKSGRSITFPELINRFRTYDLVFIGEVHDNAEHHLLQVQILQKLLENQPGFVVGLEFLPHTVQPVVDRFMDRAIDEQEFLKQADWSANWGFPFYLYRPLLHLIREQAQAFLALNAPNELIGKVARTGLAGLKVRERNLLADSIDLSDQRHRAYLKEVFQSHAHGMLKRFDFFYQAQCAWEETMAEQIAAFRLRHEQKMVVLCGNGHIINAFGIPDRVQRRIPTEMATLLLKPVSGVTAIDPEEADYVWLTRG